MAEQQLTLVEAILQVVEARRSAQTGYSDWVTRALLLAVNFRESCGDVKNVLNQEAENTLLSWFCLGGGVTMGTSSPARMGSPEANSSTHIQVQVTCYGRAPWIRPDRCQRSRRRQGQKPSEMRLQKSPHPSDPWNMGSKWQLRVCLEAKPLNFILLYQAVENLNSQLRQAVHKRQKLQSPRAIL